ncbi:sigma-70 family RNA polymerase sigma factor [Nonomuraea sp. NPDC050790]|uniref:sigma-70 family RNA polymerase sigma factor n=1 Tax=Nonomuraea sp. NPDC050790 TaxID=3364371 RepID=UPI003798955E
MPGTTEGTGAGYRPLLFSIAYGMTGSVGDAEDLVQEAFLGLAKARHAGTPITDVKAYLTTAVTRRGINHLGSARVRRERSVGDRLPEPVVVLPGTPGPAEHAELAEALSMAFLVLLESLSPVERAVFTLREVFGYGYADLSGMIGKSEANCRQIFARARQRIAAEGPPGGAYSVERRAEGRELARRFFAAAEGGDLDALLGLLAPDVVLHTDGGGRAKALSGPVEGRTPVARLLLGVCRRGAALGVTLRSALVNGRPGAVMYDADGGVLSVVGLDLDDGVVRAVRAMSDPAKLGHVGQGVAVDGVSP